MTTLGGGVVRALVRMTGATVQFGTVRPAHHGTDGFFYCARCGTKLPTLPGAGGRT